MSMTGMSSRTGYASPQSAPVQTSSLAASSTRSVAWHFGQTRMSSSQSSIFKASPTYPRPASAARLAGITAHDTQDLVADVDQGWLVRRLDVEPQQRLGVRRAQVEPPAAAADGQPVHLVRRDPAAAREGRADPLRGRGLIANLAVDLSRRPVPGELRQQRGQRACLRAERGEHVQGGEDAGVGEPEVPEVEMPGMLAAEDRTGGGHLRLDER